MIINKNFIKYIIYAVPIVLFFILPKLIGFFSDWLWFNEVGYTQIFTTRLITQLLLGASAATAAFFFIYINLQIAVRATKNKAINVTLFEKIAVPPTLGIYFKNLILPVSLLVSLFIGQTASSRWMNLLAYLNPTPFNLKDPIFSQDVSFYVFALPLFNTLLALAWWVVLISLVLTIIYYASKTALWLDQGGFLIDKAAKNHLSAFGALIFLLVAAGHVLSRFGTLTSHHNLGTGAYFTGVNAVLPVLLLLTLLALVVAAAFMRNIFASGKKWIVISLGAYFVVWIFGAIVYPSVLQKLVVVPNELNKEDPFIEHNIAFTRAAFGLERIEKRDLTGETVLGLDDIRKNDATIKNVRLWDRQPLLDTLGQVQEIRTYYDFASVDNDRYTIDGQYQQIMLSPRELNVESLPSRSFINERLTFTHGFGLAAGPVNQVTAEGLPVLFIKDIPPSSTVKGLEVKRPEIYFGELSSDYVFVKTKAAEFNYPKGEENVFQTYEGKAGVKVDSLFKKIAFALRFGSLRVLLSNDITAESRALFYRNIKERVQKIAPFLQLDSDPYVVATKEGRLVWIYDAYTTSDKYPYSQTISGVNYIRNSVKITIDAYDGTVQFYVSDPNDPLIQTYQKIFPGVFRLLSEMPADLREHLRYPEDIFAYQSTLYATYHMDQPQIFYNKEDQWVIPLDTSSKETGEEKTMMRHIIMKLPEQEKEEFILMLPFTPRGKDNLISWLVARNDGENYGKLVVYRFPKQKLIYGPKQVNARISQDAEISRQISLWDQRGSQVIRGAMLVIPIEEALLYVQPLYLRGEGGKIPELKRVIVAYENKIAMEETLEASLAKIFGEGASVVEEPKTEEERVTDTDLAKQAQAAYEAALKAQKEGNWAAYGEEIRRLGEILRKMQHK
ncbi:MAG: hypothetical protein A2113_01505 [Candidatus Woykebacteria bacterium GWA1_44_8]|uniref:UPF0182 protein A2113_01505 n=1 Tax=Candidatus Woykebacteria bacterium GWA1_44_8 TaxID=1802591 RepID=A0A1G1VZX6_9BACT|nr:MAG: hypothetical protein A2113_01505 [Candidatus Woykebacteria bacterium GWA1_44_8]